MLIGRKPDILPSEITPRGRVPAPPRVHQGRRSGSASLAGISALGLSALPRRAHAGAKLENVHKSAFTVNEEMTSLKDISTYNNFYEFGTDKDDPSENAHTLQDPARGPLRSRAR